MQNYVKHDKLHLTIKYINISQYFEAMKKFQKNLGGKIMKNKFNDALFRVKASNLSIEDAFMKKLPKTENERDLMISLAILMQDAKDFYCFKRQSFVDGIGMVAGYNIIPDSLDGLSYNQWNETARGLDYDRNSRIASKKEYILLLGVLIKDLVNAGWAIDGAWEAVCEIPDKLFKSGETKGDIPALIDIVKSSKMLATTFPEKLSDVVAFYVVQTDKNLYNFSSVRYQMSEYDQVMHDYFRDYIPPATGNPFQAQLDELSTEALDVKEEKREEIAWIVMDAN